MVYFLLEVKMKDKSLLSELRLRFNLTQREVAERLGCTQAEVSRIEKGVRRLRTETLSNIAKAFNMPVDELVRMQLGEANQSLNTNKGIPLIGKTTIDQRVSLKDKTPRRYSKWDNDGNYYFVKVPGMCSYPRIKPNEFVLIEKNSSYGEGEEIVIEYAEQNDNLIAFGIFDKVDNDNIYIKRMNEDKSTYENPNNFITEIKKNVVIEVYVIKAIFKHI